MTASDERTARILLAHCVDPADLEFGRLLAQSPASSLLESLRRGTLPHRRQEGLRSRLERIDPTAAAQRAEACGSRIITRGDREWPTQLDALGATAPLALWVTGAADLRLLALRSVAVVGARACTAYGEDVARSWSAELAGAGWTIVSGAAFGIDAAAHRGALAADGTTIAVLAGGVDMPYPAAHAPLLAEIADAGLVVSETPPGEPVRRQRFLSRNRLIAALGRATLVVEAALRSGTRTTARAAHLLNRPVLAVPGPVTSPASAGCHRMVQDGEALLAGEVADALAALDLGSAVLARSSVVEGNPEDRGEQVREASRDALSMRERTVLDAVPGRGVIGLDALVAASGLPGTEVLASAGVLCAAGWLTDEAGGWRLSRR